MEPLPSIHPVPPSRLLLEEGDYEAGMGMRVLVLAHDLLLAIRVEGEEEEYRIPLLLILDAMADMQREIES